MQKRYVLWGLILFQLVCNTLVTLNMNIAIVSMVNTNNYTNKSDEEINAICPNTTLLSRYFHKTLDQTSTINSQNIGFDWSETEQNVVLSGYYWLNYFSILPGGILAHKFGSKRIVGFTQTVSSVMSSLIPIFASHGPFVVSWIRAVQGLLSFMSVPAGMLTIIGRWSPPHERGRFIITCIGGTSIGSAIGSFCFGYVAQYIHWKYVFHLTSVCGIIWSGFWYTLIYDSPQHHPTISLVEKTYIENSLHNSSTRTKASIPWKCIVTSVPVIVCIFATNSGIWSFVMLTTYLPVNLKTIYGLSSHEIGILTSIPSFLAFVIALVFGYYGDLIIKKKVLSITHVRKTAALFGLIIPSIPLIIIAFTKCSVNVVIICIFFSKIVNAIACFGPFLVIMDLSPKFCGILEGFSGTLSSIQAFVFSSAISYFTNIWDIEELWKMVFLFTATFAIVASLMFLVFGSAEEQEWNFRDSDIALKENKPLSTNLHETPS